MKKAQRRSAKEWARLVREWERSGQAAGVFASRHGLRPRTLVWWRWRLRHPVEKETRRAKPESVELVRVQLQDDVSASGAARDGDVAWELVGPSGHVLRVFGDGAQLLRAALTAVTRGRRLP